MNTHLKQFKLSNDDEIICEVVEWNNEDNDAIIVRGVLRVINVEDFSKSMRFYAFRPWMMFHDDPSELHTINAGHIIAEINPSKEILKHYASTLDQLTEQTQSKKTKAALSLDDVASKLEHMDDEEFDQYIQNLSNELNEMSENTTDSDMPQNVVRFRPKTVH